MSSSSSINNFTNYALVPSAPNWDLLQPSNPQASTLANRIGQSTSYIFEEYADNWSYWNQEHHEQYPNLNGVAGVVAFAVANPDGSFESDYPLFPVDPNNPWQQAAPPGCTSFAVGGWNNSQPGGGLYSILTGPANSPAWTNLINTIVSNATQYNYTNVVIDYENYANPPPDPALYTSFLTTLGNTLHQQGMTLEIAISPNPQNQNFYNLQTLVQNGCVDRFHTMCYDYALGQSPIQVIGNNNISQTITWLRQLATIVPPSKIMVGIPLYGVVFQLASNMTSATVEQALENNTLTATGYNSQSTTITTDDLLTAIEDWDAPQNGWVQMTNALTPPDYFYYNPSTNQIISAFPPAAMENFFQAIQENIPDVAGFFSWEAEGDFNGTMMQTFIQTSSQLTEESIDS